MPRLVFERVQRAVASTARRTVAPSRACAGAGQRLANRDGAREEVLVACVGEVAARARRCPASARSPRAGTPAARPPRRQRRRTARLLACGTCWLRTQRLRARTVRSTIAPADVEPVACCSPCQPGMPFTSSTNTVPSRDGQQVHAGVVRADRRGCPERELLPLGRQLERRAPIRRARRWCASRRRAPAARSRRSPVRRRRRRGRRGRRDRRRAARRRRRESVRAIARRERPTSGSLTRTSPWPIEPKIGLRITSPRSIARTAVHRIGHALADDRFGRRQPGFLQQRGRVELVDRALDRARRVHDRHAALLDPVQRVDAIDDLLERSAWE